jgi:prepilin-type N-terminal cleavage/methylation domain-containing protein
MRGFTLVELLIVVAIVLLLVGLAFPVYSGARESAHKTACASNLRQIGKGILSYSIDYDDYYPRQDNCATGTVLLNPAHRDRSRVPGDGCSQWPFAYRVNHYKWPAWLILYTTANLKIYTCPSREKDRLQWDENGEIMNAYAINLALTGALNTWGDPNRLGAYRDSFLGGRTTNVPQPSSAMLLMELSSSEISFIPVFTTPSARVQTAYPTALRELWAPMLMRWRSPSDCTPTEEVDSQLVPHHGGFIIGHADTSARWIDVREFLRETPSRNDYVVGAYATGWECGPTSGSRTIPQRPVWYQEWPLWALH